MWNPANDVVTPTWNPDTDPMPPNLMYGLRLEGDRLPDRLPWVLPEPVIIGGDRDRLLRRWARAHPPSCPQLDPATVAFIPLYQLELFTERELQKCHSGAPAPVDKPAPAPRWRSSPKIAAATQVAWAFKRHFHRHRWVDLMATRRQSLRLRKDGYSPQLQMRAMSEAARARRAGRLRSRPHTLHFFVTWMNRIRARTKPPGVIRAERERASAVVMLHHPVRRGAESIAEVLSRLWPPPVPAPT